VANKLEVLVTDKTTVFSNFNMSRMLAFFHAAYAENPTSLLYLRCISEVFEILQILFTQWNLQILVLVDNHWAGLLLMRS